jgi:parallel beta-helix repeat protein
MDIRSMQKNIIKKGLTLAVIVLFICMSIIPSSAVDNIKKTSKPISNGNILYVGGNGTGNYTKIQDAINNASNGDTVFVYNGTYYENVVIDKSINLIGEDRNSTIIDGVGIGNVITITDDNTLLKNFTIQNGGYYPFYALVKITSNNNTISNNTVIHAFHGIWLNNSDLNDVSGNYITLSGYGGICLKDHSEYNIISKNIIYDAGGGGGIQFEGSNNNTIIDNYVSDTQTGIQIGDSSINTIEKNTLFNNSIGLYLTNSYNNFFNYNTIETNNNYGVFIYDSNNNVIYHNNFINNSHNALDYGNNTWDDGYLSGGNYWSDYNGTDNYHGPNQDIPGSDGIGDTSYNISQNLNQDRYPLMFPYDWPFQPIYLGLSEFYFGKTRLGGGYELHGLSVIHAKYLNVNSSLDELPLKIVLYFTVEMNYTMMLPFALSPLIAFGLQIVNYSDYSWNAMKLKHHGHWIWNENVTQEIIIHPKDFKKGDELKLYVNISNIHVPALNSPGNTKSWENILRIIYNTPMINKLLLYNWALPFLAPYNMINLEPLPAIVLRFQ